MTHITRDTLDRLVERAASSPRRRQHHNLHASSAEPCQRLLNAVWPDSYIRPHRHAGYTTNECLLALRGTFALIEFLDDGEIHLIYPFGAGTFTTIVEVPPQRWHTVVALTAGAVLFETKSGPFNPNRAKGFAEWAPAEGEQDHQAYLEVLRDAARAECARRGLAVFPD